MTVEFAPDTSRRICSCVDAEERPADYVVDGTCLKCGKRGRESMA
jgi:hypothetical protein